MGGTDSNASGVITSRDNSACSCEPKVCGSRDMFGLRSCRTSKSTPSRVASATNKKFRGAILESSDVRPSDASSDLFIGSGELAECMRRCDWTQLPVGTPDQWPQALRSMVRILLTSRYQMWMGWGPELAFFYNDAYRPTLGVKHPWALGRPASQVWSEIWPDIGPLIAQVISTGEATYNEGMLLFLERSGFPEETYHTF